MSSSSSPLFHILTERASSYAAFSADDTWVDIIPDFDLELRVPLLSAGGSSTAVGPFKAGMTSQVPLWMALCLHQRSLAKVSPPEWLASTEQLQEILTHERNSSTLWKCHDGDADHDNDGKHDDDDDDDDNHHYDRDDSAVRLPRQYYEIAKRFTKILQTDVPDGKAIPLLIQDLLDLRVDKLRQQFQSLTKSSSTASETDLLVAVNGIGTQELAILRPFVLQALNDRHFLMNHGTQQPQKEASNPTSSSGVEGKQQENDEMNGGDVNKPASSRSRVPIRRFR